MQDLLRLRFSQDSYISRDAAPLVSWKIDVVMQDLEYKLVVAAKQDCSQTIQVFSFAKPGHKMEQSLEMLPEGETFLCLFAIAKNGLKVSALNNGARLVIDRESPQPATSLAWSDLPWSHSRTITANWTVSSSNDLSRQELWVYTDSSCSVQHGKELTGISATATSQVFASEADGSFYFQVKSIDHAGNAATSSCTANAISIDTIDPVAPSSVGLARPNSSGTSASLSWNPGSATNINIHKVKLCTDSSCSSGCSTPLISSRSPETMPDLLDGVTYYGCVQALDLSGRTSAWIGSSEGVTIDTSPPVIDLRSSLRAGMSFVIRPTVTDATALTYSWSQLSGAGTINFETPTAKDTLIDVSQDEPYGIYTLRLTATDARGHVATSDLELTWDRSLVLSMGRASSCAIHPRGVLKCWGRNRSTELGVGDSQMHLAPAVVDLGGRSALSVAIGATHSCVILDNGAISCVGDNGSGQLGYGDTTSRPALHNGSTLDLGLSQKALVISAGDSHNCALLSGGSVKCWGRNNFGQLGYGDTLNRLSPPEIAVDLGSGRTAIDITTIQDASCALLDDHSLKCWGGNSSGQLGYGDTTNRSSPPASAINFGEGLTVKKISRNTGRFHTCVILSDDSIRCWGAAYAGKLGNGIVGSSIKTTPAALAAPLGGLPLAIMAGSTHSCALLSDGSVKCWGDNTVGQLGIGRLGHHTNCSDGVSPTSDRCTELGGVWSGNYTAECLNVSTSEALCEASFSCSNTTHKTQAACLGASGSWTRGEWGHCSDWLKASEASCLAASKLWDSSKYNYCTNQGGTRSLANYCADTSSIWTWGGYCSDSAYQGKAACLAAGKTWDLNSVPGSSIDFGSGKKALAVAASSLSGGNWTCALLNDLSVKCWGDNSLGYLGYGDAYMQPIFSAPLDFGSGRGAEKIVAGSNHTCSLLDDGSVKCWGLGSSGELGNGSFANIGVPSASSISLGQNAVNIASGYQHSCAVLADGSLKCWGMNANGQLGNGLLTLNAQPQALGSLGASAEAAATGQHHTCALLAGGVVKCWGRHDSGQLGIGTLVTATACSNGISTATAACTTAGGSWHANFQDCSNGNSVSESACSAISGSWASCQNGTSTTQAACETAGKLWNSNLYGYCVGASTACSAGGGTWGNFGYCSDVTHKNRAACLAAGQPWHVTTKPGAPVDLAGTPASALIAGTNYSCALLSSGNVRCWGANDAGQIGVGDGLTSAKYASPAALVNFGGHTVKNISPGASSVCAILDDDSLRCWGSNGSKKLGYPDISSNLAAPHEISMDLGTGRSALAVLSGFFGNYTCFLASDYSLNCVGSPTINYPIASGILRPLDLKTSQIPISGAVGGGETICVNFIDGTVRCTANNSVGQAGTGLPTYRSAPTSEVVTTLAP